MNQIIVIQNAYECKIIFLTFFPSHISHFAISFSNSLPTMPFAENQLNIKWKKRSLQGCLGKSYFINGARKVYNPCCQIVGLYQMKKQPLERGFCVACCSIIRASPDRKVENLSCRKNKRRQYLDEKHQIFGHTAFPLCQLLSIFSPKPLPPSRPLSDVLFKWLPLSINMCLRAVTNLSYSKKAIPKF